MEWLAGGDVNEDMEEGSEKKVEWRKGFEKRTIYRKNLYGSLLYS